MTVDYSKTDVFNPERGFSRIKFGRDTSLLETELEELQKIQQYRQESLVRGVFSNGFLNKSAMTKASTTVTLQPDTVFVNGKIIEILEPMTLTVANNNVIYLAYWEEVVKYNDTIKKGGNQSGGTNISITDIFDSSPEVNEETARRWQLKIQLVTANLDSTKNYYRIGSISSVGALVDERVKYQSLADIDPARILQDASNRLFTDAERTKLSGISTGATKVETSATNGNIKIDGVEKTVYTHPSTHSLDVITETTTKKIMTDAERTKLAGISTGANKVQSSTNGKILIDGTDTTVYTHPATHTLDEITETTTKKIMTDAERTKLAGISTGATKTINHANNGSISVDGTEQVVYAHPASHPPSIITQDANNRFMTDAERNKLAAIASGAEVNQNAFSTVFVDGTGLVADAKSDSLAINSGTGISLTADVNTDTLTIAVNMNDTLHGTRAGGNLHALATTGAHGFMSNTDKSKLDGIAAGAQVNTVTSVAGKTGAVTLSPGDVGALPASGGTITGDLTVNGAFKPLESQKNAADALSTYKGGLNYVGLDGTAGRGFPTDTGTVVTLNDSTSRNFQLFHTKNTNSLKIRSWHDVNAAWTAWDELATVSGSDSKYVSKTGDSMSGLLEFGAGQSLAPDAVSGAVPTQGIKWIADSDYYYMFMREDTTGEKTGLVISLADNSDDYFQIEQVSPGGEATPAVLLKISESGGADFKVQPKYNGTNLATTAVVTTGANGLMIAADKSKLDGIAANANNYVHPASHPPSIITQDASNRFVTDTEKSTWNAKASTAVVTTGANGLMIAADKLKLDGLQNSWQATLPAASGWYRIATSPLGIARNSARFEIDWAYSGTHGQVTLNAGIHYGQDPTLNQLHYSSYGGTSVGISKARIVYHTTYDQNYAYLEVYNASAVAQVVNVQIFSPLGWGLVAPNTAGSVPSGYSTSEITFIDGIQTDATLKGNSLQVTSTSVVANLNADMIDGAHAGNAANNVLKLDASAKVPVANLTTYAGIDSTSTAHVATASAAKSAYDSAVAWAKSFGLGDVAKDVTSTDLNSLTSASGFYKGQNMTNAPSTGWWYIINLVHASNYVTQMALQLSGTAKPLMYLRINNAGAWGSWIKNVTDDMTATTSAAGIVALYGGTDSTSTTLAATPSAVKSANDNANNRVPYSVTLGSGADLNAQVMSGFYRLSQSHVNAPAGVDYGQMIVSRGQDTILQIVTNYASGAMFYRSGNPTQAGGTGSWGAWKTLATTDQLPVDGTTAAKGIVQLSSATNSTSTTLAATASAVKSAYDLANSKATAAVARTTNSEFRVEVLAADPASPAVGRMWLRSDL